jgi:hypothetical protein
MLILLMKLSAVSYQLSALFVHVLTLSIRAAFKLLLRLGKKLTTES